MDDKKLDELLADAAQSYRVSPAPPLDAIWSRVEAEVFAPVPVRRGGPQWRVLTAAIAASLAIGVAMGRYSSRPDRASADAAATIAAANANESTVTPAANTAAQAAAAPYQRSTEEYLGSTALLLAALPHDGSGGQTPTLLPGQAAQLLTTTRLLLDSPVGENPRMMALLQDLELVLAQVARLQPRREKVTLTLISQTLEERELVPRIRSAVADLSTFDY